MATKSGATSLIGMMLTRSFSGSAFAARTGIAIDAKTPASRFRRLRLRLCMIATPSSLSPLLSSPPAPGHDALLHRVEDESKTTAEQRQEEDPGEHLPDLERAL